MTIFHENDVQNNDVSSNHGPSQDFFRGGEHFFKNISKKLKKIKKIFKNIQKISKNFRKFLKIFLRKLQKMHYFSIFFSQFNEAMAQFLRVLTKTQFAENF